MNHKLVFKHVSRKPMLEYMCSGIEARKKLYVHYYKQFGTFSEHHGQELSNLVSLRRDTGDLEGLGAGRWLQSLELLLANGAPHS